MKKELDKNAKEVLNTINGLIDNDEILNNLVYKIFSIPEKGIYHILFLDRIKIKGKYLKKLYEECCNSNYDIFLLTLNMLETLSFSLSEITENLNLEKSIPFVYNINEETIKPIFYNKLEKHKDYCVQETNIFKKNLEKNKSSKTK